MARFEKGQPRPANAGRKPGSRNKTTAAVKAALLRALQAGEEDGGEKFFSSLREEDPKTFAALVGKLIPTEQQVTGGDVPLVVLRDYTGLGTSDDGTG